MPQCPPGYFAQPDRTCSKCHDSCYACSGALSTECTACIDGQQLSSGKCLLKCKTNQYFNLGTCQNCPDKCALCMFEDNAIKCLKCKKSYVFRYEDQPTQCLTNCKAQAPDAVFKINKLAYDEYDKDEATGYCKYVAVSFLFFYMGKRAALPR